MEQARSAGRARPTACGFAIPLFPVVVMLAASAAPVAAGEPCFTWQANRLVVRSPAVELAFEAGAIVSVRDRRSGEQLSAARAADFADEVPLAAYAGRTVLVSLTFLVVQLCAGLSLWASKRTISSVSWLIRRFSDRNVSRRT